MLSCKPACHSNSRMVLWPAEALGWAETSSFKVPQMVNRIMCDCCGWLPVLVFPCQCWWLSSETHLMPVLMGML